MERRQSAPQPLLVSQEQAAEDEAWSTPDDDTGLGSLDEQFTWTKQPGSSFYCSLHLLVIPRDNEHFFYGSWVCCLIPILALLGILDAEMPSLHETQGLQRLPSLLDGLLEGNERQVQKLLCLRAINCEVFTSITSCFHFAQSFLCSGSQSPETVFEVINSAT
jgi:hypothetical protein